MTVEHHCDRETVVKKSWSISGPRGRRSSDCSWPGKLCGRAAGWALKHHRMHLCRGGVVEKPTDERDPQSAAKVAREHARHAHVTQERFNTGNE